MATKMDKSTSRVDWIDLAKGLTIILVLVMHSIDGVELALGQEGWMHPVLAYATPFRMPVFFAVAGLFAARAISKDLHVFMDSKLAHFGYFYFLWLILEFFFKAPFFIQDFGAQETVLYFIESLIQPFGPLWFIYLLPIYFIVLRASQRVPMVAQFALAIAMKLMTLHTGIAVLDFFAKYYVFFLAGHFGRDLWFSLASSVPQRKTIAAFGVVGWAMLNGVIVYLGYDAIGPVAIVMGVVGFMAVITTMVLLPFSAIGRFLARGLHFCGQRSLPMYLGFFLPMGITRLVVLKFGNGDPGLSAFVVAFATVTGAIIMYEVAKRISFASFLYERPDWARLRRKSQEVLIPAE